MEEKIRIHVKYRQAGCAPNSHFARNAPFNFSTPSEGPTREPHVNGQ